VSAAVHSPDLIHWQSKTKNGGRTTIIPSAAAAIAMGRGYVQTVLDNLQRIKDAGWEKVQLELTYRHSGKVRKKTLSVSAYECREKGAIDKYSEAASEITVGDPAIKHSISELAAKLMQMALDLNPSIKSSYCGFERWEDGDEVLMDLLREGDDRPFLRRKLGQTEPRSGKGDGAYRIILNTDVAWWGTPTMNASVMGALVLVLQQYSPVEIWIQQGWLGDNPDDGVSLFKLDFNGNFDPTQLAFWCGSKLKDVPFSQFVNRSIGRECSKTSIHPELPCDLYLRGDWMTLHGIDSKSFPLLPPAEQLKLATQWIADTCANVLYGEEAETA
jgi:hypothetical protein